MTRWRYVASYTAAGTVRGRGGDSPGKVFHVSLDAAAASTTVSLFGAESLAEATGGRVVSALA